MKRIDLDSITPLGELCARASLLAARLEAPMYSAAALYDNRSKDWQGDWEGRTILANTLLCRTLGKEPAYLDEIIRKLPDFLNARGYLGTILPDGEFDEQQMSGHSWLLRGLCEYAEYRHSHSAREYALTIVQNLFLPAKDFYRTYPIDPSARTITGGAESGNVAGRMGAWHLSTDTGCAYIPIDGVSAVFELTRDTGIEALLREMITNFLKVDFSAIKAQTHATLTAVRGILRTYGVLGEPWLLDSAIRIFDLYLREGMTANYENCNWFGRPEWTEPCAVIDSFLIAMELFRCTGKVKYIHWAQLIYYNGMLREQRPNGGFGCNVCTGFNDRDTIASHCYEAFWCCSMRGGEGLARAAQYGYFIDGNRIIVPYLSSSTAELAVADSRVHIRQITDYPYEGSVRFDISGIALGTLITLDVFVPDFTGGGVFRSFILDAETRGLTFSFTIPLLREGRTCRHGALLLGADPAAVPDLTQLKSLGSGHYQAGNAVLAPINDLWTMEKEQAERDIRRILF